MSDNVTVSHLKFNKLLKVKKKRGRPLDFSKEGPKKKVSILLRPSIIKEIGDRNRSQLLNQAWASSKYVNSDKFVVLDHKEDANSHPETKQT